MPIRYMLLWIAASLGVTAIAFGVGGAELGKHTSRLAIYQCNAAFKKEVARQFSQDPLFKNKPWVLKEPKVDKLITCRGTFHDSEFREDATVEATYKFDGRPIVVTKPEYYAGRLKRPETAEKEREMLKYLGYSLSMLSALDRDGRLHDTVEMELLKDKS